MSGSLLALARRLRRARDRRWTSRRWLRRIHRSGLFDRQYFELQTGSRYRSDVDAIRAFLRADPTSTLTFHPLVEGGWIEREAGIRVAPWYVTLLRDRSLASSGPLRPSPPPAAREQQPRALMSELAAFTDSSLDDRMLEPVDEPAAHVPWDRVRTVMRDLAGQTTRQLAASSRRNAIEWDAQSDARYVAGVLGSWSASRPAEALVSIVMPTYNRAGVIERAIESVQRQTYQNWELLVVDDGSTDGTSAVLAKLQKDEPRLTVLTTPRTGVSAARNRGLDAAIGTYLAFLDTDNAWRPHFLATSVIELERLPVAGTFSAVDVHRDDGRHEFLGCQVGRQELLDGPNQVDLNALVVRRDVVTLAGGFDETLPRWVDYDLVLRVAKDGELRYLPTVGVAYDHHSTAADRISVVESSHWREVVLEKNLLDWEELRSSTSRVAGRRSVLIRSSRQWPATLSTVRRVLSAPGDVEVVILDNGSPREDAAILTAAFVGDPRVIVRRLPWMLRLATSTNLAFAQSTGTIITVVEPGEIGDQAVFSSRDILRSQGFEIDGDDRGFAPRGLVLRGAKPIQPKED